MPEGRGLHGTQIDFSRFLPSGMARGAESGAEKFLDLGNWLRYGMTLAERQDMIQKLQAPGVREHAYQQVGEPGQVGAHETFDPAAAERYTSAYLFGRRFAPNSAIRPLLHGISGGSRKLMSRLGVPGVDVEREALRAAEEAGMSRGSEETAASSYIRGLLGG